ncbi:Low affinity iron permease [Didymella exigua CBS 183.55]|uniref:Low affinity iron permease n=1 Tax=Didymella exigua CBS 183.55 TaxID=1150837 RepID=A0A6A5RN78_9PLEO|nr:Low affinity iron permease [Didymella exigua CBS 183.55]KAF1926977.1 Low affinity iron permease [Didymella exigua CBS 183.55]
MPNPVIRWLCSPGARTELQFSVPTHVAHNEKVTPFLSENQDTSTETPETYVSLVKSRRLDRWLDRVVVISGSEFTYVAILIGLLVWAFLGIPFGTTDSYKIVISDAQAIINLVFDAFLMRQQFNQHDNLLMVAGSLRSRASSHKRMLGYLVEKGQLTRVDAAQFQALPSNEKADQLPREDRLTRLSSAASSSLGHIGTAVGFWCCIFIWLGFGHYCGWSSTWQLYINSATSALMVLLLAFLANTHERHSRYTAECLKSIWKADAALELHLRELSGDRVENPMIVLPERKRSGVQRAIDYYADLVGTLAGVVILVLVIIIWIICGPALHFDSSWWLLMGTYAGLVGLNDGFVLRNIFQVLGDYEDEQFIEVNREDHNTLAVVGVESLDEEQVTTQSLSYRISVRVGYFCSYQWMVVSGVVLILGLIVGASAMRWTETGQLLCNIPPSVIESFFTLILITGHNIGEAKRRVDLHNINLRRLKMISYVEQQSSNKGVFEVVEPTAKTEVDRDVSIMS